MPCSWLERVTAAQARLANNIKAVADLPSTRITRNSFELFWRSLVARVPDALLKEAGGRLVDMPHVKYQVACSWETDALLTATVEGSWGPLSVPDVRDALLATIGHEGFFYNSWPLGPSGEEFTEAARVLCVEHLGATLDRPQHLRLTISEVGEEVYRLKAEWMQCRHTATCDLLEFPFTKRDASRQGVAR